MIDFIFTHDSSETALKTRDTLYEFLKGSNTYVNNSIILSDGTPECESDDWTRTLKSKNGKEIQYKHCICLTIGTDSEKVENTMYQVIHIYDNEFDSKIGTLDLFLKS